MGKTSTSIDQTSKINMYRDLSIDTCIYMGNAMGIPYKYDDYSKCLLVSHDYEAIKEEILKKFKVTKFDYDENGYDGDVIPVILEKVEATMEVKASDYDGLAKDIVEHQNYVFDDNIGDEYKKQFEIAKQILVVAQKSDVHTVQELEEIIGVNVNEFVGKFMFTAYEVLPNWNFSDVKYYKDFIFAILAQFKDLHAAYGSYALMDVADLHIWHGNDADGDRFYNYLLRETPVKDYVYYRFAFVYSGYDPEKARTIAKESMRYIDDKFFFYDAIVNILEN